MEKCDPKEKTDERIKLTATYLRSGYSVKSIHDYFVTTNVSEEEIFLVIMAGKLLLQSIELAEKAEANKPAPFGRKK